MPKKLAKLKPSQGATSDKEVTYDDFNRYATVFASTAEKEVDELILFMRGLESPESFEKMSRKHNGLFAAKKGLGVAAGTGITIGATAAGAAIGTAIMPVVGTVVGGALGAGVGAAIGIGAKKAVSKAMDPAFSAISEKTGTVKNIYPRTKQIRNKIDIETSDAIHGFLYQKTQVLRDLKHFNEPDWRRDKLKEYGPQLPELALNKIPKTITKVATDGAGFFPSIPIVDIAKKVDDTSHAKHTSLAKLKKIDVLLSDIKSVAESNIDELSQFNEVSTTFSYPGFDDDDEVALIDKDVAMGVNMSLLSKIEIAKGLCSQLWSRGDLHFSGESSEWFNKDNDDDFLGVNIGSRSAEERGEINGVSDSSQSGGGPSVENSDLSNGAWEYQPGELVERNRLAKEYWWNNG
ncbi:hypothetical protein D3C77_268940 [compost metagenome]